MEQEVLFVPHSRYPWKKWPLADQLVKHGMDGTEDAGSSRVRRKATKKPATKEPRREARQDPKKHRRDPVIEVDDEPHPRAKKGTKKSKTTNRDTEMDEEPSTCCLHGRPCRASHMPIDTSQGWIATLAKSLAGMIGVGSKMARSPSSSSSSGRASTRGAGNIRGSKEHIREQPPLSDPIVEQPRRTKPVVCTEPILEQHSEPGRTEPIEEQHSEAARTEPVVEQHSEAADGESSEHDDDSSDGEHSEHGHGDKSLGLQTSKPAAALRSLYVAPTSRIPQKIAKLYNDFRTSTATLTDPMVSTRYQMTQDFFIKIESCTKEFKVMPEDKQLCQTDSVSCGVYACMYLDRLLGKPTNHDTGIDEGDLEKYWKRIASKIFSMTVAR